ncbi:hypothetical protein LQ953_07150 [Sphingomonas sp. IC-56]|uniref:hypothetical protein n=1 Tax=Sphingomonas sp. IC-56 TaxID=2898529 RepID=UPI001E476190|nr:hypothetical protein [Sphingomonas sp. IC-56]MCD2323790.1 hypothetical protein [Sphingomonas sp. IC-56]
MPSRASTPLTAESALRDYCEPLISGAAAAQITKAAEAAGFKPEQAGGHPILMQGELILSVSDAPRVCLVQAPTSMTFPQGISLVDAWAARNPGAVRGAATKGPDGARVKLWAVPKNKKYLLVTEQTNARGQKVLNFILAPMPAV